MFMHGMKKVSGAESLQVTKGNVPRPPVGGET